METNRDYLTTWDDEDGDYIDFDLPRNSILFEAVNLNELSILNTFKNLIDDVNAGRTSEVELLNNLQKLEKNA